VHREPKHSLGKHQLHFLVNLEGHKKPCLGDTVDIHVSLFIKYCSVVTTRRGLTLTAVTRTDQGPVLVQGQASLGCYHQWLSTGPGTPLTAVLPKLLSGLAGSPRSRLSSRLFPRPSFWAKLASRFDNPLPGLTAPSPRPACHYLCHRHLPRENPHTFNTAFASASLKA
jgi:hypothetical protein